MNQLNNLTTLIFTGLLYLSLVGCEKFVTVDLPQSQLTGTAVFEDGNTATAALLDVYSLIRDEGLLRGGALGSSFQMGTYSDELDSFSTNVDDGEFYYHSLQPTNGVIEDWWRVTFLQVYQLNILLEGLDASNNISLMIKDQLKGEALFLRSLIFFQASNIWGDIPYITTSDYRSNAKVHRDEREWVLEQIAMDLDLAISLLPEDYPSKDRTRANRYTAMALQGRLALYQEQWEKVELIASEILSTTSLYQWEEDQVQNFKIANHSTIWQLQAGPPGRNTSEASTYIINSIPPVNVVLSKSLYDSFEPGDRRLANWIGTISDEENGITYHFPFKYRAPFSGTSTEEYNKVFRLAEVYLMRAEAFLNLGNMSASQADLNKIRLRSGLPPLDISSPSLMLEAIVEERRHELFTEYGHRWFDLKRLGIAKNVLAPIKQGWKDTNVWLPIPEKEIIANSNLQPQNKGY